GTQKLSKHVGYSTTLSIPPELIAPGRRPSTAVDYQLFGVVYHHGKSATGGHYTADILRDENEWLHIDDTTISSISADEVTM
ncbi:11083_t:CDS:2, partial [Acaulospora morrowiae]